MYGTVPKYLQDLLIRPPPPKYNLRFTDDTTLLIVPLTKLKTFASRSFSIAGPREWNLLPRKIREIQSYEHF